MVLIICAKCGEEKEHQAKGLCYKCYKKYSWKPRKIICDRCKREMPFHAKGLCPGCYNFVFQLDRVKSQNYKKWYELDMEDYKKITKSCVVCSFDKIVALHHLDENRKNNSRENLVGLCPNHHQMFHNFQFRKEIRDILVSKGFGVPEDIKIDFERRK